MERPNNLLGNVRARKGKGKGKAGVFCLPGVGGIGGQQQLAAGAVPGSIPDTINLAL